jgi:apolipoprotein N-acyltransferase
MKGREMKLNKLALVGFILSFIPIASLVGMILSIVGLVQVIKSRGAQWGKVFAILGMVLGFIGTIVWGMIFTILAVDGHL